MRNVAVADFKITYYALKGIHWKDCIRITVWSRGWIVYEEDIF